MATSKGSAQKYCGDIAYTGRVICLKAYGHIGSHRGLFSGTLGDDIKRKRWLIWSDEYPRVEWQTVVGRILDGSSYETVLCFSLVNHIDKVLKEMRPAMQEI